MLSLPLDPIFASLLILLGAMFAYALDEVFRFTGRLTQWMDGWMDSE
jgi:hypothetical protein